jgi:hypothetical protein
MVQATKSKVPVRLIAFGTEERLVGAQVKDTIETMDMYARAMIRR